MLVRVAIPNVVDLKQVLVRPLCSNVDVAQPDRTISRSHLQDGVAMSSRSRIALIASTLCDSCAESDFLDRLLTSPLSSKTVSGETRTGWDG